MRNILKLLLLCPVVAAVSEADITNQHIYLYGTNTFSADVTNNRTLFWQPSKMAFRAGYAINNNNFKNSLLGSYSFGFGYNIRASGSYSIAMGSNTEALSTYASDCRRKPSYSAGSDSWSIVSTIAWIDNGGSILTGGGTHRNNLLEMAPERGVGLWPWNIDE